jgi:hypothetical protein
MKLAVLILSVVAIIVLFIGGGLLFALSGFGFDTANSPNDPVVVRATFVGFVPGLALEAVALSISLSAMARSRNTRWFIGLLIWPLVPIVAGVLMLTGVVGYSDSWWFAFVFLPLATLIFGALGPAPQRPSVVGSTSDPTIHPPETPSQQKTGSGRRFIVFASILSLATVLGFATLVLGTPPGPAPDVGPSSLDVQVATGVANCSVGTYPAVTILNTGGQAVSWSASSTDPAIHVSPSSGSLGPGESTTVTISGRTSAQFIFVGFNSQGTQGSAKIPCGP